MSVPATEALNEAASWRGGLIWILILAAVLRVILVLRGGQFSQRDEDRYGSSREGAELIAEGHLRAGIARPLEGGDHVGFKELGLLPALVEEPVGRNHLWIPGFFFGSFSIVSIALLAGIAGRLSGSPRAQFWAAALAAGSGALFYFARHLLPYDASMAFILGGVYLSLKGNCSAGRLVVAGLLAGCGFVVYYGSWMLAGVALIFATLCAPSGRRRPYPRGLLFRATFLGTGFVSAIALPVLVNRLWGGGHLLDGARALSASITTGDFRGHRVPWDYLWSTDHLELPILGAFCLLGAAQAWRTPASVTERIRRPGVLSFAAIAAIYAMLIVTGTWMHTFAVHDRLVRQLLPFLVLGGGIGIDVWLRNTATRRHRALVLGAILAVNSVWAFWVPLAQEWPAHFKARADRILDQQREAPSADAYYRYVNTLLFYGEPEVPRGRVLAVLARSPHFYQYRPYLFEAMTPEERLQRERVDSSMRLVKMAILPEARIVGDAHGRVTLRVILPQDRFPYLEPLLSMGQIGAGDVFFIRYYGGPRVAFGYYSTGQMAREGPIIELDRTAVHTVQFLCGDLIAREKWRECPDIAGRIQVECDGKPVFEAAGRGKDVPPERIYAGVNAVAESYTASEFSGQILGVSRADDPSFYESRGDLTPGSGPETFQARLILGPVGGIGAEPIAVVGVPREAIQVFLHWLPGGKASFGCEYWGLGIWESPPLDLPLPADGRVEINLGPLLPAIGAKSWGLTPAEDQASARRVVSIRWRGAEVFRHAVPDRALPDTTIRVGRNPIGGSHVHLQLTGTIREAKLISYQGR